jgi:hypothetical protein
MEQLMLPLQVQTLDQPGPILRARRIEVLAEIALQIAAAYEAEGRLDGALTLVDAVLRDPDLPPDRPALLTQLRSRRARLLVAQAAQGVVDLQAARAAVGVALDSARALGDERTIADLHALLSQLSRAAA